MADDIRTRKIRKRTFIITVIDFVIIFLIIGFVIYPKLSQKEIETKDYTLQLRYSSLPEDIGYLLSLSLISKGSNQYIIGNRGQVNFLLRTETGERIWDQWTYPQKKALDLIRSKEFKQKRSRIVLKKDEMIKFHAEYKNNENGLLDDGKYRFSVESLINGVTNVLSIPVIIKNGKDKKLF
ncbi:MAG: hypothetical protein JW827_08215 [Spirochaetes bacterium]|nr:hypothetical protein [Spirochaetota bacterium]